jgi:hypothetical protein
VAHAQGGRPNDVRAEKRADEAAFARALARMQADVAAANAAIRDCNPYVYFHAKDRYYSDFQDLKLHPVAGKPPDFPEYPEHCTPPPTPGGGGGGPRFGPHYVLAGAQPFVGLNIGGGFQNTNFSVAPPFTVNSNGVTGGGFGGVLFPVPNTNAQFGFRFGGEGGNITGNIVTPPASPTFKYTVKTDAVIYQEAMFKIAVNESPVPQDRVFLNYNYFQGLSVTGSVGVAESHSSVNGTAGAFSVTDSGWRPGITFTAGIGVPVATLPNGAVVDLFAQYRGIQWISTVNIPGAVNIGSFTNEVDVGATVHFNSLFDFRPEPGDFDTR